MCNDSTKSTSETYEKQVWIKRNCELEKNIKGREKILLRSSVTVFMVPYNKQDS